MAESDSSLFSRINSWNQDRESLIRIRRSYFSALNSLFHFRESLLRIRQEPLFLKKTAFDRTPLILLRISSVELCQREHKNKN
jgi:hypothetical protein